jgi:hypothetical protein
MKIYIKLIDKSVFDLDVDINSSVLFLKYKIEEDLKIEVCRQRLIYNGTPLVDEYSLWQYNLRENAVVNLVYQMAGG